MTMMISKLNKAALPFIILILIVVTTLSSCKKDDDTDQAAIDHELIEQYVADKQLDGQFTSSGLYYVIEKNGNGDFPYATATVTVSYKGFLLNGTAFDQGEYFTAALPNLILGWQEGIQLIDAGGKIKLITPSHLAYGSQSVGSIPANSVLVFDVILHTFEK
jgi:FKBP-type peptidyl-prolyl cis-trans isomerase FkpA